MSNSNLNGSHPNAGRSKGSKILLPQIP